MRIEEFLDLEVLHERMELIPEALIQIILAFPKNTSPLSILIADALRAGDMPRAEALFHKLRGESSLVGATALMQFCEYLEEQSHQGQIPEEDLARLIGITGKTESALTFFLGQSSPSEVPK